MLKPPIAIYSPMPPIQSGIAASTDELLSGLVDDYHVEIFADDEYTPTPSIMRKYRIHHYTAYKRRSKAVGGFKVNLHQLGNSRYHVYHYWELLENPDNNVVMIHDLPFGLTLFHHYAQLGDFKSFRHHIGRYIRGNALRWYDYAYDLWRETGDGRELDEWFMDNSCLDGAIQSSRAQIVQTQPAFDTLKAQYSEDFRFNPRLIQQAVQRNPLDKHTARQKINFSGNGAFMVGCFGHVARTKRLEKVLLAFGELLNHHPDSVLMIAGPHDEQSYSTLITEMASRYDGKVAITGHLEKDDFEACIAACDMGVGLRTDAPGQYSAGVLRLLAAGKPVAVSDLPQWAEYPNECCPKVPQTDLEVPTLAQAMISLATSSEKLANASKAAVARYGSYGLENMIGKYKQVLNEVIG
jgi:glycosyltransferase involved in cell wall biosynthesis